MLSVDLSFVASKIIIDTNVKGSTPMIPAGVGPSSMEEGDFIKNRLMAAMPFKAPCATTAGHTLSDFNASQPMNIPPEMQNQTMASSPSHGKPG